MLQIAPLLHRQWDADYDKCRLPPSGGTATAPWRGYLKPPAELVVLTSGPAYRARISERGGFEKADRIVAEQVWDAARKIASMGTDELFRLFGNEHFDVVIRRVSVTEAVKQVSAWERAKKEGFASKVRVGIEVRNAWGTAGKVVGIKGRNIYVLWCDMDRKEPMISKWDISQVAPTGRDFPDIADLLQDMAEIQKEKDG